MGFNIRPFQLLRSYKRHEENKSKIGQVRNSLQQADYHRYQLKKKARSEEEEKERKRDRKDRGQDADGKKGSPTKQNTSEELKQGLPT